MSYNATLQLQTTFGFTMLEQIGSVCICKSTCLPTSVYTQPITNNLIFKLPH